MTIVSTANNTKELKSFPPVTDLIDKVKSVDWAEVRLRALIGVNYVGSGLSVLGRGIYTLGEALRKA